MNLKRVLLSVLVVGVCSNPFKAFAHTKWWDYSFQKNVCEESSNDSFGSPDDMIAALKAGGIFAATALFMGPGNSLQEEEVQYNSPADGESICIHFFSTLGGCKSYQAFVVREGSIDQNILD